MRRFPKLAGSPYTFFLNIIGKKFYFPGNLRDLSLNQPLHEAGYYLRPLYVVTLNRYSRDGCFAEGHAQHGNFGIDRFVDQKYPEVRCTIPRGGINLGSFTSVFPPIRTLVIPDGVSRVKIILTLLYIGLEIRYAILERLFQGPEIGPLLTFWSLLKPGIFGDPV